MVTNKELIKRITNKIARDYASGVGCILMEEGGRGSPYDFRVEWSVDPQNNPGQIFSGIMINVSGRTVELYICPPRESRTTITHRYGFFEWHFGASKMIDNIKNAYHFRAVDSACRTINKVLPGFVEEELILCDKSDS